jgi:N-acetylmuramoyl-L-alanine amidase
VKRISLLIAFLFSFLVDATDSRLVAKQTKGPFALKTIVIDAGHGGHDTGCLGATEREKNITLEIALKLGALIQNKMPGVKVIYTRTTDVFIELYERANIANKNNADLFISIHCNANKNTSAYGTETWVMGLHKSEANLEVAQRENSSILLEDNHTSNYEGFDPNAPESYIVLSLNQNAYLDQSILLASKIEDEFNGDARTTRGVKQAGYLVLWRTTMPAILIETGFLTNRTEEKYLASEDGQSEIVNSIFDALKDYKMVFEQEKVVTPIVEKQKPPVKDSSAVIVKKDSVAPIKNQVKIVKPTDSVPLHKTIADSSKNHSGTAPQKIAPASGIIYKVQIAASSTKLNLNEGLFIGTTDIENDISPKGWNRYVVGKYIDRKEAEMRMKQMTAKGFKGSFLVAYKNGVRVPIENLK